MFNSEHTFTWHDTRYTTKRSHDGCSGCAFQSMDQNCHKLTRPSCMPTSRYDRQNVIFVEVSEHIPALNTDLILDARAAMAAIIAQRQIKDEISYTIIADMAYHMAAAMALVREQYTAPPSMSKEIAEKKNAK